MNPLYNTQQTQREHHFSQVKLVQDTAKALHDFRLFVKCRGAG